VGEDDQSGAYPYTCLVAEEEWSHSGLGEIERCCEMHAYARTMLEASPASAVAYSKGARRAGMLATLWWLTGWVEMPEEEVE
jgi:hypothetical protein